MRSAETSGVARRSRGTAAARALGATVAAGLCHGRVLRDDHARGFRDGPRRRKGPRPGPEPQAARGTGAGAGRAATGEAGEAGGVTGAGPGSQAQDAVSDGGAETGPSPTRTG